MISPDPYSQSFSHQLFTSSSVLKSFEKPTALAIDRGGEVFTGSADGDIQIKDLTTDQTIPPPPRTQNQQIMAFAFDNEGTLFVGYRHGPIEAWNLDTLELKKTINIPPQLTNIPPQLTKKRALACAKKVYFLVYDSFMLISSHGSGLIQFWKAPTLTSKMIMQGSKEDGGYSLTAADGKLFAAGVKGIIKVFALDTFKRIDTLQSSIPWITSLAVGDRMLFAGGFREIEIWDMNLLTYQLRTKLTFNQDVRFSSLGFFDGMLFAGCVKSFFTPFSDITKFDFKAKHTAVIKEIADQLENENPDVSNVGKERLSKIVELEDYRKLLARAMQNLVLDENLGPT